MPDAAPIRHVAGIDALRPEDGPLFAVVGVFDGIHLGHQALLEALVAHAHRRGARPAVLTFDSHPDEVLLGAAPPLLLDPADRVRLLEAAGVEVVIVQPFDEALRATPYDAFVARITDRVRLAGLLMTPEAAFGHERRGTPDRLAELGRAAEPPFEVVVVPPRTVDGRPVSSSEIRRLVAAGDLAGAERLLGRPYSVSGTARGTAGRIGFALPVALPPEGAYAARVGAAGTPAVVAVRHAPQAVTVEPASAAPAGERVAIAFGAPVEWQDPGLPVTIRRS